MCCNYAAGEQPPSTINSKALEIAIRTAMLCDSIIPSQIVVMRQRCSESVMFSGWKRSCMVGLSGALSYLNQELPIERIFLEESTDPPSPFSTKPVLHTGSPQIRLESGIISDKNIDLFLRVIKDMTESTGETISGTGRWILTLTLPRQGSLTLRGIQGSHRVKAMLLWARSSFLEWQKNQFSGMEDIGQEHLRYGETQTWDRARKRRWEVDPESPCIEIKQALLDEWRSSPYPKAWQVRAEMQFLDLSRDAIDGILQAGRAALYLRCKHANPKVPVSVWGELLYRWPKSLERRGVPVHALTPERYLAVASLYGMGRCQREVLCDLLAFAALFPEISVRHLLRQKMGVTPLSEKALEEKLPRWLSGPLPRRKSWRSRERYWMGRVMTHLRGSLPGSVVRSLVHKYFASDPPSEYDRCEYPPQPYRSKKP